MNKNNTNINLKKLLGGNESIYSEKPYGHVHNLYLSGEIGDAEEYHDWFELLRNAPETDVVTIHINSPGGQLYTSIQFLRVLAECNAHVIGSIEGLCASAATMIFLACDEHQITSHSAFMIHNYSGGTIGKGNEMHAQIDFEKRWISALTKDIYKHFLSPSEIEQVLEGKDFWFTAEETWDRLGNRQKKFEADQKKAEKAASDAVLGDVETKKPAKSKRTKPKTQLLNE